MSDWDLMMPGMGLTAIGLAGVVVSYAGIAKTFIDGMHALTGLTMFIGMIFLACGILSGGVSTSNKAKATTLVIFGIAASFGAFAFTMSSVTSLATFTGVLLIIIIPTIVISYAAMKIPQYAKPISVIFIMAAGVGIASFVSLGFVGPGAQFSLQPPVMEEETEKPVEEPIPITANIVPVEILAGAATPDNPDYSPDPITVTKGDVIEWANNDNVMHTVTSLADAGATFDSSIISAGDKWTLDTGTLATGEYDYFCTVHPFMTAKIIVSGSSVSGNMPILGSDEPEMIVTEPSVAKVSIPAGAMIQSEGQIYYDPQDITVSVGTTVIWSNDDTAAHTVTSGADIIADGVFDSGILPAGKTFEHKFDTTGTTEYFCQVHPWMVGTVTVE